MTTIAVCIAVFFPDLLVDLYGFTSNLAVRDIKREIREFSEVVTP